MALRLSASGLNDCEVARATGIPRRTILDWRHGRIPGLAPSSSSATSCYICAEEPPELPERDYAYLLGLYLGDGCVSAAQRTHKVRFTLDSRYPKIVRACANALEVLVPPKRAWRGRRPRSQCVDVTMYWNHWPCVFPQHGPGRKHERRIALAGWQQDVVGIHPRTFLRGLFHSDGCRVVANDRGISSIRYHFSNRSEDIKALYCGSLDALGIQWTRPCAQQIAVYRKSSVALLDAFLGPKM